MRLKFPLLLVLWTCVAHAERHPVEIWLGALRSEDRAVWGPVAYSPPVLAASDRPALRILISALSEKNPNVRKYAASALGDFGFEPENTAARIAALLDDKDYDVRSHAAVALAKLGSAGIARAATVLSRRYDQSQRSGKNRAFPLFGPRAEDYAEMVLRRGGMASLPALIGILDNATQNSGRQAAMRILTEMSEEDKIPAVFSVLVNDTNGRKALALEVLELWGNESTDFLKTQLTDSRTRISALLALAQFPTIDQSLVSHLSETDIERLITLLHDEKMPLGIRLNAARLLGSTADYQSCALVLRSATSSEVLALKLAAIRAIPAVCKAPSGLPALEYLLHESSNNQTLNAAIEALSWYGAQASSSVPSIAVALRRAKGVAPDVAISALAAIGGDAAFRTATQIAVNCGSEFYVDCLPGFQSITRFGEPGLDVLALRSSWNDSDSRKAASVLKAYGPTGVARLNEQFIRAGPEGKAIIADLVEPTNKMVLELEKAMFAEGNPKRRTTLAESLVTLDRKKALKVVQLSVEPSDRIESAARTELATLSDAERGEWIMSTLENPSASSASKQLAVRAVSLLGNADSFTRPLAGLAADEEQGATLRVGAVQALIDTHHAASLPWSWLAEINSSATRPEALKEVATAAMAAQVETEPERAIDFLRIALLTNMSAKGAEMVFSVLSERIELQSSYKSTLISIATDKHRVPHMRAAAIRRLPEFLSDVDTMVPILRELLAESLAEKDSLSTIVGVRSDTTTVAVAATQALGVFGEKASSAVRELSAAAARKNRPDELRIAAATALSAIDPGALAAISDVERILLRGDSEQKRQTIVAIASTDVGRNLLRTLLASGPESLKVELCLELGGLGLESAWAGSDLFRAVSSTSERVRRAAVGALLQIDSGAHGGSALATELNEEYIRDDWSPRRHAYTSTEKFLIGLNIAGAAVGGASARADTLFGAMFAALSSIPANASSTTSSLPELWERPPIPSARDDITELVSPRARTLEEARQFLTSALRTAGFDEIAVYEAPAGFTLITKVERIHDDGSSFQGQERWSNEKVPLRSLSLAEYLKRLFLEKPGQFRLMAFVVSTGFELTENRRNLTEQFARLAVLRGARGALPLALGATAFEGHRCDVLVYHFEKRPGGGVRVVLPSEISARVHLSKAQLMAPLVGVK